MSGFALTADGDLDLGTSVGVSGALTLGAAIHVALQTWRGTWRGNLRTGIDRQVFLLRQPGDIAASLRAEVREALRGLPMVLGEITVTQGADRVWTVTLEASTIDGQTLAVAPLELP